MYTQAPLRLHDVVPGDELGEAPRGGEEPVGVVAHGHEVALVVLAPAPLNLPPLHPGLRGGPGHHSVQCTAQYSTADILTHSRVEQLVQGAGLLGAAVLVQVAHGLVEAGSQVTPTHQVS